MLGAPAARAGERRKVLGGSFAGRFAPRKMPGEPGNIPGEPATRAGETSAGHFASAKKVLPLSPQTPRRHERPRPCTPDCRLAVSLAGLSTDVARSLAPFSLMSNHYHMIVRAESAKRLSRFVGYFNSNLAREVSRLTGWTGKIWDRRYQAILISNEEEVQVARFRYVLSHGVCSTWSPLFEELLNFRPEDVGLRPIYRH